MKRNLIEVKMVSCERCDYAWLPRVGKPVKCPKCGHRFDSNLTTKHKVENKVRAIE